VPVSRPQLALQRWQDHARRARVFPAGPGVADAGRARRVFDGGGARDGGLAGLARFTSAMIGEGTSHAQPPTP
jgi:hypothetical protein